MIFQQRTEAANPSADAIRSRRAVAGLVKDRGAVGAFPRFMDDIRRAVLTPTQKLGCELLAEDTLLRGFYSVCYGKLEDLVLDAPGEPPRANLAANDLTPLFKQLEGLRIIRAEWSQRDGWYVLLFPGCEGWNVQWRCPASRRQQRWMHLDGLRRAAAPFLPSFAPDADLYDALARAGLVASADLSDGLAAVGSDPAPRVDALGVQPRAESSARASCRSDFRNGERPANGGGVLEVGMGSIHNARARARLSKLGSGIGQKAGQKAGQIRGMDRLMRDELKGKLHGDEREFRFAATAIIGAADWDDRSSGYAPNGVRWMKRWQAGGEHKAKAVAVFAEMLTQDFVVRDTAASAAQNLWAQFGGADLDAARLKKIKESFKSPTVAR